MKKRQIILLILISVFIFLITYVPHYQNSFPIHIDEWHHISEATKLRQGEYPFGPNNLEFGFHAFLMLLSLFTNLPLVYQFLPAIWTVLTALVLFFIVNKKTNNFIIAVFSMIFFASIKSNVNILGLWFFTPLTFSIPFIFLYIYFFTEGIEKKNKKYILLSLAIMLFLIPTHAPSALFAIPFLTIYSALNLKYLKKEYKLFSLFLLIPLTGILFYSKIMKVRLTEILPRLTTALQFKHGWGVLELNNSFLEIYSLIGYALAILGILIIFKSKNIKRYWMYILWPLTLFISILIFKITEVSYLSPYQRNIYYFAISLPILSAIGLYHLIEKTNTSIKKINFDSETKDYLQKLLTAIIILLVLFLTFQSYLNIPKQALLYKLIDKEDYQALQFLSEFPKATVLTPSSISTAVYPISGHNIVAGVFFYKSQNKKDVKTFFSSESDCTEKQNIIQKYNVEYILSKNQTNCNWKEIYNKDNYVYKVDNLI